jgi:hypothetical protein
VPRKGHGPRHTRLPARSGRDRGASRWAASRKSGAKALLLKDTAIRPRALHCEGVRAPISPTASAGATNLPFRLPNAVDPRSRPPRLNQRGLGERPMVARCSFHPRLTRWTARAERVWTRDRRRHEFCNRSAYMPPPKPSDGVRHRQPLDSFALPALDRVTRSGEDNRLLRDS